MLEIKSETWLLVEVQIMSKNLFTFFRFFNKVPAEFFKLSPDRFGSFIR